MSNKKMKRRDFVRQSATAALGFTIVPRHVLGRGFTPPSDKLNIAAIGAGGKGSSDITNAYNKGANNVVALCDVDYKQAENTIKKFSKAKLYKDFRVMLEQQKDIDAVTISTPDHTHAVAAMRAMSMGKHVYVQKPLTHNINEARQLTLAARKYKVVTQMGNQGASNPEQEQFKEWVRSGLVGPITEAYIWTNRPVWPQGNPYPKDKVERPAYLSSADWDLFIGPAEYVDYHPLFHPFKWRGWWNFGTGALGDMGCHLIDPAFKALGLGYPTAVECSTGQYFTKDWTPEYTPEAAPLSSAVQLDFPETDYNPTKMKMFWYDGGIRPFHPDLIPAKDPIGDGDSSNGVLLIGNKGVITCGTYGVNPRAYLNDGTVLKAEKPSKEKFPLSDKPENGHQIAWTEACKAGFESLEHKKLTSSFDYAGPLTETVLMGNLAIRSYMLKRKTIENRDKFYGRVKMLWNGDQMRITNFDDANQFVTREYRKGFELMP